MLLGVTPLGTGALGAPEAAAATAAILTLDSGSIGVSGSELAVRFSVTLDTVVDAAAGTWEGDKLWDDGTGWTDGPPRVFGISIPFDLFKITLDTRALMVAGADLGTPAFVVLLDTGAGQVLGADLSPLMASTVVLDSGSVAAAGADLTASLVAALDAGTIAGAGNDLSAPAAVQLDTDTLAVAGNDLTPLAEGEILLDTGTVSVAGANLAIDSATVLVLDTGFVAAAGADLATNSRPLLEAGSIAVAGADVLAPRSVSLDSGAITAAGNDLAASRRIALDTRSTFVAGADLSAPGVIVLLTDGDNTVLGNDLIIRAPTAVVLDDGAVAVSGSELAPAVVLALDTVVDAAAGTWEGDKLWDDGTGWTDGSPRVFGISIPFDLFKITLDTGGINVRGNNLVIFGLIKSISHGAMRGGGGIAGSFGGGGKVAGAFRGGGQVRGH